MIVASLCAGLSHGALLAQVSGTEVNQEAVDGFGLERKTGRFSWSTGEIIGIGDEKSRIGVSIMGIRNPPRATITWPQPHTQLILDEPRLLSEPMPNTTVAIDNAVHTNLFNRTVESPVGSETFQCFTESCIPEYTLATAPSLEQTQDGFTYISRTGVLVFFEPLKTKIVYPDGRVTEYRSGQYRKNNFGFLIKYGSGGDVQAVNQAIDYCDEATQLLGCTGLSAVRTASLTSPSPGYENITDSAGYTTTLHWQEMTAKLYRRPSGAPPELQIVDVPERYPLGITLPGSTSEDITISYRAYDPAVDTHDEILIESITKNGIISEYSYNRNLPQGYPEYEPGAGEVLNRLTDTLSGGLLGLYEQQCDYDIANNGAWVPDVDTVPGPEGTTIVITWTYYPGSPIESLSCHAAAQIEALIPTLEEMALQQSFPDPPGENNPNNLNLLEMTITQSIGNEVVGTSEVIQPGDGYANKRRRLIEVIDGLNRPTEYFFNQFEELAGQKAPEGNGVLNEFDGRGNLISTTVFPKTGSTEDPTVTLYSFPSTCDDLPLAVCNSPTSMTDPLGNVTNYEYNDRGQLTKEIGPAPAPGAARPTVVNEYEERTAYIKNASGNPVAAGQPISMLIRSYTCISSATCGANTPAADKVVTDFDYGPTTGLNNILLRGITVTAVNAAGQIETRRTCYQYNYFGERISETMPGAGLTSCPA